ncbi:heavy-metal-associated domain-containing protein [Fundicoccus culcitae]|uniref:Copper chaperone CopZ n=1 Tax=Fundicoccus culcitae TaxID=2969821 RepID=A0ABY5P288_9LACT|nr:heavy metal-associated domain-containing protein [Fundicoccus culcitae]UUX32817.1 heavy-metal-associated domain-containing protein [Fundicoccus culcitae]
MEKTFKVKKMGCQNCANTIHTSLSQLTGVNDVEVSLQDKTAKVQYDANLVQPDQMVAAVSQAGYELID